MILCAIGSCYSSALGSWSPPQSSCYTVCSRERFALQFGTDFKMMNAETGRSQTTQGVWMDLSPKILDVPTLVLDLEGSDGRERGEDDTTFERQSALFALATSDILMINLFAVNVGRVQGSGAPLLKTVLQVQLLVTPQSAPIHGETSCSSTLTGDCDTGQS
jgi:hypothetical protein